ncbi:MAG: hypothetical protein NZL95_06925 [Chitinophagales bacterium]|nr:hypothetical protein [Chitinophagales bacterium]MDW8428270.1 hypothetical protein [Chitinophagales bacterium]
MWQQIRWLTHKEFVYEWRSRYLWVGLLLYLSATTFLVYLGIPQPEPSLWVTIYWIVLFFVAVTAVARSFLQESRMRMIYMQSLASPLSLLLAKMIYHGFQLVVLAFVAWLLFALVFGSPIVQTALFALIIFSGSLTFVLAFSMMSAIAAKANQAMLMTLLCLPVILPSMLLIWRLSEGVLSPKVGSFPWADFLMLWALDVILLLLALILFPYLWRD